MDVADVCEPTDDSAEEAVTSFASLLTGDAALIIVGHLYQLADVAALSCVLLPRPEILMQAAEQRAALIIRWSAPLVSAASNFTEEALWPISVSAANWRPHRFFCELREPPVCKVAGRGTCAHGLCQKQETPKAGVLELLEQIARTGIEAEVGATSSSRARDKADEAMEPPSSVLALECLARLLGALGRNERALAEWARAAKAGSARAQLDAGVRAYSVGTPSTVYDDPDTTIVSPSAPDAGPRSAAPLLRAAVANRSLGALGLEGSVIQARALMLLGMMALDGDGVEQDDDAAFELFERVQRTVRVGKKAIADEDSADAGADADADANAAHAFWAPRSGEDRRSGHAALAQALLQAGLDAKESAESMDRFMYFANGRP